ncbi:hypothetical protein CC2G_007097 [Coprinopsis cinerea AmutBmut pab1-1]|nr:hypothetical protein CC2G_007097 [Coprinopsis cinerea AmutBmut pab1-1]
MEIPIIILGRPNKFGGVIIRDAPRAGSAQVSEVFLFFIFGHALSRPNAPEARVAHECSLAHSRSRGLEPEQSDPHLGGSECYLFVRASKASFLGLSAAPLPVRELAFSKCKAHQLYASVFQSPYSCHSRICRTLLKPLGCLGSMKTGGLVDVYVWSIRKTCPINELLRQTFRPYRSRQH